MNNCKIHSYLIIAGLMLFSCVESDKELKKKEAAILVGDEFLLADEIKSLIIDTGNPKDTIGTVKQSVDDWMAESLLYQEALSKLNEEEIQIESQIENYKKALVNHIYSTKLIEVNLDTNVSYGEVKAYYEEHKDNFILKDNIVKVHYLKVLLKAPPLNKIKKLVYSNQTKDKEQLEDLCSQYADNYFLNDSTWIYLEDMKKEVPKLKEQDDIYLYKGKVIEVSDDEFYYFLRFNEIKIKNSVSPLNFELNNIKKFIINKRKTQLLKDYKVQLLEKAREEKRIIINSEKLKLN